MLHTVLMRVENYPSKFSTSTNSKFNFGIAIIEIEKCLEF